MNEFIIIKNTSELEKITVDDKHIEIYFEEQDTNNIVIPLWTKSLKINYPHHINFSDYSTKFPKLSVDFLPESITYLKIYTFMLDDINNLPNKIKILELDELLKIYKKIHIKNVPDSLEYLSINNDVIIDDIDLNNVKVLIINADVTNLFKNNIKKYSSLKTLYITYNGIEMFSKDIMKHIEELFLKVSLNGCNFFNFRNKIPSNIKKIYLCNNSNSYTSINVINKPENTKIFIIDNFENEDNKSYIDYIVKYGEIESYKMFERKELIFNKIVKN